MPVEMNIDPLVNEINRKIESNFKKGASMFTTASKQRMPHLTGNLKSKTTFDVKNSGNELVAEISSDTPYANRRYFENYKNPNAKEWFEKEYEANEQKYNEIFGSID